MFTTIIFDLSEVYLHGMMGIERRVEKELNISIKSQLFKERESEQFFHGEISEEEFWKNIIDKNKWNISVSRLKHLVRTNMTEIEGTREIIEKLKENGYRLGLLSVHGKEWVEYCETQFDYHKLFHSVLYSFEVAVCKPERKAYELILKKLKSTPQECIFIDDFDRNLIAAKELGITAIQFTSPGELMQALLNLGVRMK